MGQHRVSRRGFVKAAAASASAFVAPAIVPSRVLGALAPSNQGDTWRARIAASRRTWRPAR